MLVDTLQRQGTLERQGTQPQRDMSHTPLFQAMFALQDAPFQALRAPGLTLSPLQPDTKTAKFDLMLNVVERTDTSALCARIQHRSVRRQHRDPHGRAPAGAARKHRCRAAPGGGPDAPITALPLLTAPERRMMLADWNDTAADVDTDSTLAARFEEQAARTPDAPAVVVETERGGAVESESLTLSRVGRPGVTACRPAGRARRRAGKHRRPDGRSLGRSARRSGRHLEGGRGLCAARSGVPCRPAGVHARRFGRRPCSSRRRDSPAPRPRTAGTSSSLTREPGATPDDVERAARRAHDRTPAPTTWRTLSTPQARPAGRRASPSPIAPR